MKVVLLRLQDLSSSQIASHSMLALSPSFLVALSFLQFVYLLEQAYWDQVLETKGTILNLDDMTFSQSVCPRQGRHCLYGVGRVVSFG